MFFHVILTGDCNLQCKYCFGESLVDFEQDLDETIEVDYNLPRKINYDVGLLDSFCRKDPGCVLTFYGGEPLLQSNIIKQIMDEVEPKHFMIQTNGLLLDKLEPEYINRFHTILVSIDGKEILTDYYRGRGTFRKVIDNLKLIMKSGFDGELIARMTVMEHTNINEQVRWLLNNSEFSFTSIHWQLNAGFWGNDYQRRNFENWANYSYIPGIKSLVRFWANHIEENGVVPKIYPFLGVAESFLKNEGNSLLRCGGGWINYAIQTDGHIIPCPTMWGMKTYYLDHISKADPLKLKKIFVSKKPCAECSILQVCGGRCLYANVTKRWNDDAYAKVCLTVKQLVEAVKSEIPMIHRLMNEGKINVRDFNYMKYNGCEIIP
jgi:uncharacterized protein